MIDSSLPRCSVRLNASRPALSGFSDLISMIGHHYNLHVQASELLGPYNARQRAQSHYLPPTKELLRSSIKQGHVNDFTYLAFITSLVRFCEETKGSRALPTPHPSVIHSIQLPSPAFSLQPGGQSNTIVNISGTSIPLVVGPLRKLDEIKFIIVRPKLSKLGTASVSTWEVLFFRSNLGYIPDWCDTMINPRYAGTFY